MRRLELELEDAMLDLRQSDIMIEALQQDNDTLRRERQEQPQQPEEQGLVQQRVAVHAALEKQRRDVTEAMMVEQQEQQQRHLEHSSHWKQQKQQLTRQNKELKQQIQQMHARFDKVGQIDFDTDVHDRATSFC